MRIGIANFKGEIPRLHKRLLPEGFAQIALNARLTDGGLQSYRDGIIVNDFETPVRSIYKYQGAWLGYDADVDFVQGPVANDRLYFTGDGVPKVRVGADIYPLALAKPVAAPTVAPGGTLDTALQESIVYTYTFLTSLDEESAPAPLSATVEWSPGMTVTVSGFSAAPGGRAINRRRIYRSQTSKSGVTDLYFVAEIPLATTSYVHDLATAPMAEVIPSLDYDTPPDTLHGLTELPGGMMAAFDGRELLFSEPFAPHAWPIKYRLKTNYPIVGLSAFGSTVAVMTTGTPYIVQGASPESLVMERMESNLPCVAARSIVDLGYAAAYASNDGLVLITASSTQIATRSLFTKEEWQRLSPATIFAASLEGRYIFAHFAGAVTIIDGGNASVVAPVELDLGHAPDRGALNVYDGGYARRPDDTLAMGIVDLSGESPFYASVFAPDFQFPTGLYYQTEENTLFVLEADTFARQFDAPGQPDLDYRWMSRCFYLSGYENFGAIWVEAEGVPSDQNRLITRVFADGKVVFQTDKFGKPTRLPSGFTANQWEIEVEGNAHVSAISMAGSLEELMV